MLHEPLGTLLGGDDALRRLRGFHGPVISVGDECSYTLIAHGIKPNVVIYDHRCMRARVGPVERKALDGYDGEAEVVVNPAGAISEELLAAVGKAVAKGKGKILVDGEEDLAALVAIIAAADGAVVLYGQPGAGVVLVEVNKKSKGMARAIYGKMVPSA